MKILLSNFVPRTFQDNIVKFEIIENHIHKNDTIYHIDCDGSAEFCMNNVGNRKFLCYQCILYQNKWFNILSNKIEHIKLKNFIDNKNVPNFNKDFISVDELKTFTYNGVNLGLSVASELISFLLNQNFPTQNYKTLINNKLLHSYLVYNAILKIIDTIQPDLYYIFNGRFSIQASEIQACRKTSTPFYTYEVSVNTKQYSLVYNQSIHSREYLEKKCRYLYNSVDYKKIYTTAKQYLTKRCNKKQINNQPIYHANQQECLLPSNFSDSFKNIVYFNSTPFEFCAIEHYGNIFGPYESEDLFITKICSDLICSKNTRVYVRMHPNMHNDRSGYSMKLKNLHYRFHNLFIIPPNSPIDSYQLIKKSDTIIVTHSTIGAEAAILGKPVIIFGQAVYKNLGGFYNIYSHDEMMKLLTVDLDPLEPIGAYLYFYYSFSGGIPFLWYKLDNGTKTFRGIDITNFLP